MRGAAEELTLTFGQVRALENERWLCVQENGGGMRTLESRYGPAERVLLDCRNQAWRYKVGVRLYVPGHRVLGEPDRLVAIFEPGGEVSTADGVHYYYNKIGKWCRKRNVR